LVVVPCSKDGRKASVSGGMSKNSCAAGAQLWLWSTGDSAAPCAAPARAGIGLCARVEAL